MKVNRLGKSILEAGYKNIGEFIRLNNIGVRNDTMLDWVKAPHTVYAKNMLYIDRIAEALETSRNEVLNMISTKAIYDSNEILNKDKSPLRLLREKASLSTAEVAELVGEVDNQFISEFERGKRKSFPSSTVMKNYMDLFDLSFTQLHELQAQAIDMYNKNKKPKEVQEAPYIPEDKVEEIKTEESIVVLPLPEIGATPVGYETKPVEPVEADKRADEVIRIIYGKVDYDTFRAVEKILREVEL